MAKIVTRLREQSEYNDPANGLGDLCGEAADEIERQEAAFTLRTETANRQALEILRLRMALWEIVELTVEGRCDDEDGMLIANAAERIARKALGE